MLTETGIPIGIETELLENIVATKIKKINEDIPNDSTNMAHKP